MTHALGLLERRAAYTTRASRCIRCNHHSVDWKSILTRFDLILLKQSYESLRNSSVAVVCSTLLALNRDQLPTVHLGSWSCSARSAASLFAFAPSNRAQPASLHLLHSEQSSDAAWHVVPVQRYVDSCHLSPSSGRTAVGS
jgi:hypothetical protein